MTKDDVSDLKSLIARSEHCALLLAQAKWDKAEADRQLEVWLTRQQNNAAPQKSQFTAADHNIRTQP